MNTSSEPLILVPDRRLAGAWLGASAAGSIVILASVLADPRTLVGWTLACLSILVTMTIAALVALPNRFVVRVDDGGLDVALPWQAEHFDWHQIHLARVVRVLGEQVLECWVAEPGADRASRTTSIYLPLGCQLDALHERLERHLGHADAEELGAGLPI